MGVQLGQQATQHVPVRVQLSAGHDVAQQPPEYIWLVRAVVAVHERVKGGHVDPGSPGVVLHDAQQGWRQTGKRDGLRYDPQYELHQVLVGRVSIGVAENLLQCRLQLGRDKRREGRNIGPGELPQCHLREGLEEAALFLGRERSEVPVQGDSSRIAADQLAAGPRAVCGEPCREASQLGHHVAVRSGHQCEHARQRKTALDKIRQVAAGEELRDVAVHGNGPALRVPGEELRGEGLPGCLEVVGGAARQFGSVGGRVARMEHIASGPGGERVGAQLARRRKQLFRRRGWSGHGMVGVPLGGQP